MARRSKKPNFPSGFIPVRKLGKGEGSVVWEVREESTGSSRAVKLATTSDPTQRLRREFTMLNRFNHPGIVKVHSLGKVKTHPYFTMDLIDGMRCDEFLKKHLGDPEPYAPCLGVFGKIVSTLSHIHSQGVVHADIKAANVLIRADDEPVLLDFGFAEDYMLDPTEEPRGTLDYVAPELFGGGRIGPAVDIYSLGVLAYEVFSGKRLWAKKSPRALIAAKLTTPPGFPEKVKVPRELEQLILRMVHPEAGLRPSLGEAAAVISGLLGDKLGFEVQSPGFAPVLSFGGRETELQLAEKVVIRDKNILFLKGPGGSGKTLFIKEFGFRSLIKRYNVVSCLGRGPYLTVIDHLGASVGLEPEKNQGDPAQQYERILNKVLDSKPHAVLVDVPRQYSGFEEEGLGYLARGLKGKVGLLISGVEAGFHPRAEKLVLEPLDEETVRKIVNRSFEGMRGIDIFLNDLMSASEGIPRRINEFQELACHAGWLNLNTKGIWEYQPPGDPDTINGELAGWLTMKGELLSRECQEILVLLAIAQGPICMGVLDEVFKDREIQWPLRQLLDSGLIKSMTYLQMLHYEIRDRLLAEVLSAKFTEKKKRSLLGKLVSGLIGISKQMWDKDISDWDDSYLVQTARLCTFLKDKRYVPYMLAAGKTLSKKQLLGQARDILESLLECDPSTSQRKEALTELGRIVTMQHDAETAEKYYSQALELTGEDPEEQAKLLMQTGWAYRTVNKLDSSDEFLDRAERKMKEAKLQAKSYLLTARGWNCYMRGQLDEAEAIFRESRNCADEKRELARASYCLAQVLFLKRSFKGALDYGKQSLRLSEEIKDPALETQSLNLVVNSLLSIGELEETDKYLDRGLELCKQMEDPYRTAQVLRYKGLVLSSRGQYRQSRSVFRQALEYAVKTNDRYQIQSLSLSAAANTLTLGEWNEAEKVYRRIWSEIRGSAYENLLSPYILRSWAELYLSRKVFGVVNRMLVKARRVAQRSNDLNILAGLDILDCKLAIECGDYKSARIKFDECRRRWEHVEDIGGEIQLTTTEAQILLNEGNTKQALETARKVLSTVSDSGYCTWKGEAIRLEGLVLISEKEFEQGVNRLRESVEVFKSQENIYEQGRSLFEFATVLFDIKGYCDEAAGALDEAGVIFERIGAEKDLDNVRIFRTEHFNNWRQQPGLSTKYLEGLKRISELINYRLGEEDFMIQLLSIALDLTGAERGMIFLAEDNELYSVATKGIDSTTARDARSISRTIIRQIRHGLRPVYTADAFADDRFNRAQSILLNNIRSILCVPLKTSERMIGTIYLDSQVVGLFDSQNMMYFEAMANLLAATIDKSAEFTRLRDELHLARQRTRWEKSGIVLGSSPVMEELYQQVEKISQSDANVLLEGQTGTGKGVFARMIHEQSPRRKHEFCSINCGVVPENLFEAELFGYRKGAFSGATEDHIGLLEAANGSTVFFDEITNTSPAVQAKLLEVIEERRIRRLREPKHRKINLRFIFATNRDLKREVRDGNFREDLYFRINALRLKLPLLRDRAEDIGEFVDFFVERSSKELNKNVTEVDGEVMQALLNYEWPGNIRELANVIERAVLLAPGKRITRELLDHRFFPEARRGLQQTRRGVEKELIQRTLIETRGNVTRASQRLGISRQHLSRLITRYNITRRPK